MTSAFSLQNSIGLCPDSFCTPRPNLPVSPHISCLPTFAFQSAIMKKTSLFWVLVLEGLCIDCWGRLSYLFLLFCGTLHSDAYIFPFPLCFLLTFFSQLFVGPPQTTIQFIEPMQFIEPFNFSFFSITGEVIDLDYCYTEWFALEMNRDNSVVFKIESMYCILDSFVDYDGYSISSKRFLPTVVDIMVLWVKFTHSSPF